VSAGSFRRRVLSAVVVLTASCVHPAWTDEIRERYGLSEQELKHVQFFTSAKITLRRERPNQQRKVVDNELVIEDELLVDDVVIRRGTPGVMLRLEGNHILISFSQTQPDRALWFTRKEGTDGRYRLSHLAVHPDEQPFQERYAPGFAVHYAGQDYRVLDADSWKVYLTYEDPQSFDEGVNTERPEGWKLR
jgi:hypothetical protein